MEIRDVVHYGALGERHLFSHGRLPGDNNDDKDDDDGDDDVTLRLSFVYCQ